MQLDLASLPGQADPKVGGPIAVAGDKGMGKAGKAGEEAPVVAVFAALLSSLTPAAPEAGTTGGDQSAAGAGTTAQAEDPATGAADGTTVDAALATAGPISLAGAIAGMPPTVSGESGPAVPVEVPRDPRGLPLDPGLLGRAVEFGETPAGTQVQASGEEAAGPDAATPARPLFGLPKPSSGEGVSAAGTTPADPEATTPDGRPVPVPPGTASVAAAAPENAGDEAAAPAAGDPEPAPATDAMGAEGEPTSPPVPHAAVPGEQIQAPAATPATAVQEAATAAQTVASAAGTAPASSVPTGHGAPIAAGQTITDGEAQAATARAVDPQRIQAQALRHVLGRATETGAKPQQLTLQLEPEHLGKLQIKLSVEGDRLQVEFQADTPEAGHALREGRHELVRALTAHQAGRWHQVEIRVNDRGAEPEGPARDGDETRDERSEHGSRRERDHDERRRRRGDR